MTTAITFIGFFAIVGISIYCVWSNARLERERNKAWEKKESAWTLERKDLVDRIMYMADRPWDGPAVSEVIEYEEEIHIDPLMTPIPMDERYDFSPVGSV